MKKTNHKNNITLFLEKPPFKFYDIFLRKYNVMEFTKVYAMTKSYPNGTYLHHENFYNKSNNNQLPKNIFYTFQLQCKNF